MLVLKNDGFRPTPTYGAEFHTRLIVACRIQTDRYYVVLSELMKNRRLCSTLCGSKTGLADQEGQMSEEASGSYCSKVGFRLVGGCWRLVAIAAAE